MEKYKEYKAMMLVDGHWKNGTHWTGAALPIYRDEKHVLQIIEYAVERWEKETPKEMPKGWKVVSRDVTKGDWK